MRRVSTSATRQALRARSLQTKARVNANAPSVQITTLPNKIRVASEAVPGHFSGVGLFVDAGSRYETKEDSGVSHFLDRMAFKVCDLLVSYIIHFSSSFTIEHSRTF